MHFARKLIAIPLLLVAMGAYAQTKASPPEKVEDALVCAAAFQTLMGKPYRFRQSTEVNGVQVQQFQSRDGAYVNSCYLQGAVVVWRTDKSPSHTKPGRWRTHVLDEKVTWVRTGEKVSITVTGGAGSDDSREKTYTASHLRQSANLLR